MNKLKTQIDWKTALQKGLSLIIDTNDEYDVRSLLVKKSSKSLEKRLLFDEFKEDEKESNFFIMLHTISERSFLSRTLQLFISRPDPNSPVRGGALLPHGHQGYQGERGVCGTWPLGDSLSDRRVPRRLSLQDTPRAGLLLLLLCSSQHEVSLPGPGQLKSVLSSVLKVH